MELVAAPITHVVLTDKVFNKFFQDKERKDFFIGTIFPDIRYLGVTNRKITHFPFGNLKIEDIEKEENSFRAGFKFHSLVDEIREKYIRLKDVYFFCPNLKYKKEALKLFEDELYYNRVSDWTDIINFLNEVLAEEGLFNIQEKDIRKWHKILQDYFFKKPDRKNREKFGTEIGFPKDVIEEINDFINQAKSNDRIKQIIEEFYNNFEMFL